MRKNWTEAAVAISGWLVIVGMLIGVIFKYGVLTDKVDANELNLKNLQDVTNQTILQVQQQQHEENVQLEKRLEDRLDQMHNDEKDELDRIYNSLPYKEHN